MAGLVYLSAADVLSCGLDAEAVNQAVEAAFRAKGLGQAATRPALSVPAPGRASFRAKAGVLSEAGYAAVKWYGYYPENTALGLAEFTPLILLNETVHGRPLALIDGAWITDMRTAAVTAVAASALAVAGATEVAFVGCGNQARANLLALMQRFPLRHATLLGRRPESTAAFADYVRAQGVTATVVTDPREALAGAQLVVSSVPRLSPRTQFLDASWTAPGCFVSMVDTGVAWAPGTLGAFDRIFTDDMESAMHVEAGDADVASEADLCAVVGGQAAGRNTTRERIALVFKGIGLADVAVAAAIWHRATQRGLGRVLEAPS
jgi:ornithine cyclodeaminase/alanine dehydrogenase-like protein (mu-crystallin family)